MENSLWINTAKQNKKQYEKLIENKTTEVCIIGGGLTGLTTGYYLTNNRKKSNTTRKR